MAKNKEKNERRIYAKYLCLKGKREREIEPSNLEHVTYSCWPQFALL